tara:strand:- start:929 stop:2476 length:1548 start_codon:yes stop_codon:yes gene_type:complete
MITECGIFCIISNKEIGFHYFIGSLKKIQHRGRDSWGVSYYKNNKFFNYKFIGLINNTLSNNKLSIYNINSKLWLGHVRYTTNGVLCNHQIQPIKFTINYKDVNEKNIINDFTLAFNGNIPFKIFENIYLKYPDFKIIIDNLKSQNDLILNDTLIIIEFFKFIFLYNSVNYSANNDENIYNNIKKTIIEILNNIDGAFTIVLQTSKYTYVFKDKFGLRPGSIIKHNNNENIQITSESCVLDSNDNYNIINILPNTIYCINNDSLEINIIYENEYNYKQCIFEFLYFLNVETINNNIIISQFRKNVGKQLAIQISNTNNELFNKFELNNTIVCGVPKSGLLYAQGFCEYTNIKYEEFLQLKINKDKQNNKNNENSNHERTFILNTQVKRKNACKNKYQINDTIKNKICILIDDSIVRGTTLNFLINYIKSFEPKEIHFISASPSIKYPCFYGVDFADIEDLYFNKSNLDLEKDTYLNIDNMNSLTYLSLDNLKHVFNAFETNKNICTSCFDGNYLF